MKITLLNHLKNENIEFAESLIRTNKVLVNKQIINIPSHFINPKKDIIELIQEKKWVSRGAYKLLKAIETFNLKIKDKVVLDIGSSTGGFTQVALENGARLVYALDVGTNQLDYSLRINKRVVSMEKTNLKSIEKSMFAEKIDLVVCDVSFIGLKEVFKSIKKILIYKEQAMLLIKPQFEASKKYVSSGGFVEEQYHDFLINRVKEQGKENGFDFISLAPSPITGNKSNNIEYISLFERNENE